MNRLKLLRTKADLTLRVLEKYLKIPNATLSLIENNKQPMREIHVKKLTSFFDVTSDYLLGYSNTGIGIYFDGSEDDDDHAYISASEFEKLNERYEIKERLIPQTPSSLVISTLTEEKEFYNSPYTVFRSVNIPKEEANIVSSIRDRVIAELNNLDTRGLEKVLKFINEYIK